MDSNYKGHEGTFIDDYTPAIQHGILLMATLVYRRICRKPWYRGIPGIYYIILYYKVNWIDIRYPELDVYTIDIYIYMINYPSIQFWEHHESLWLWQSSLSEGNTSRHQGARQFNYILQVKNIAKQEHIGKTDDLDKCVETTYLKCWWS